MVEETNAEAQRDAREKAYLLRKAADERAVRERLQVHLITIRTYVVTTTSGAVTILLSPVHAVTGLMHAVTPMLCALVPTRMLP